MGENMVQTTSAVRNKSYHMAAMVAVAMAMVVAGKDFEFLCLIS